MPGLAYLLAANLLIVDRVFAGRPFLGLSPKYRAQMLSQRMRMIGCYGANFTFSAPAAVNVVGQNLQCSEVCGPMLNDWKQEILGVDTRPLNLGHNVCVSAKQKKEFEYSYEQLDALPHAGCHRTTQCLCHFRLEVHDIFLSPPKSTFKNHQGQGYKSLKHGESSQSSDPQAAFKLQEYGSSLSPKNCNASGFAPWLAAKMTEGRPGSAGAKVTISDEVADLECENFIKRFDKMKPDEVEDRYKEAVAESERIRKSKKAEKLATTASERAQEIAEKLPKKQRLEAGSSSVPKTHIPDWGQPAPFCRAPGGLRWRAGPGQGRGQGSAPAGAAPAPQVQELLNLMDGDARFWASQFKLGLPVQQDGDEKQQPEEEN